MDYGQFCMQVSSLYYATKLAVEKTSLRNRISIILSAVLECYYRVLSDIALQLFIADVGMCLAS